MTIWYGEVVARLLATVVLCGLIGLERETRDQAAGFRTHILLGLGAALFTLASAYGFPEFSRAALESGGVQFDPTRIAAQIVTGVGFLGAGAIILRIPPGRHVEELLGEISALPSVRRVEMTGLPPGAPGLSARG